MENSIDEKFSLIERIGEVRSFDLEGQPIGLLAHSVLNAIALKQLIVFFNHEYTGSSWVSGNICKRLPLDINCDSHYDYLFDALREAAYIDRLRLRKPMDAVISQLSETRQMEYFSYFFHSQYSYERKAALKLSERIWNSDIQSTIIKRYEQFHEVEILAVLLKCLEINLLVDIIKSAYSVLPRFLKGIVVNRLKVVPLKDLYFLIACDPSNFLRIACLKGEKVDDETCIHCYENIPDAQRPFALYNLSLLGKWELVKPEIEKYLKDPDSVFSGFGNLLFE